MKKLSLTLITLGGLFSSQLFAFGIQNSQSIGNDFEFNNFQQKIQNIEKLPETQRIQKMNQLKMKIRTFKPEIRQKIINRIQQNHIHKNLEHTHFLNKNENDNKLKSHDITYQNLRQIYQSLSPELKTRIKSELKSHHHITYQNLHQIYQSLSPSLKTRIKSELKSHHINYQNLHQK